MRVKKSTKKAVKKAPTKTSAPSTDMIPMPPDFSGMMGGGIPPVPPVVKPKKRK